MTNAVVSRVKPDRWRVRPDEESRITGVSIVIPAYNEAAGISDVVRNLAELMTGWASERSFHYEIVVVDDGSTDATSAVLESLGDIVRVIQHPSNRGYGAALKTGILHTRFEWVLITDADGTYPNERIPDLLDAAKHADMVVGARTMAGAHIPLIRRPAKWALTRLASYMSQTRIPDLNSGLRLMRRQLIEENIKILPNAFSFTTTITLAALSSGWTIAFVPVEYHKRKGHSKIRPIADTINFTKLILRTTLYFDPLRIFIPAAFVFFLTALTVLLGSWLWASQIMDVTTVLLFVTGVQLLAIGVLADLVNRRSK